MRYGLGLLAVGLLMLVQTPATAHPHVYVDAKTGFRVDDQGQLTRVFISWTYDAFTTLFLFDVLDLDRDRDGKLDQTDFDKILRGETHWSDDYRGDTYLEVNERNHPLLKPVDAQAFYANEQITVQFELPLEQPIAAAGEDVVLRVYDPTYYHAYAVTEIVDPAPLPDSCEVVLYPFQPDTVTGDLLIALSALSQEETPEQSNVGRLFSDEVVLLCD